VVVASRADLLKDGDVILIGVDDKSQSLLPLPQQGAFGRAHHLQQLNRFVEVVLILQCLGDMRQEDVLHQAALDRRTGQRFILPADLVDQLDAERWTHRNVPGELVEDLPPIELRSRDAVEETDSDGATGHEKLAALESIQQGLILQLLCLWSTQMFESGIGAGEQGRATA
jgi:hypothetical protein